jgi:gamma-glutamyltranspeptidase/glutathione hydrolase
MTQGVHTAGGRVGPKAPVSGRNAVCASQSPIVTETMLETMRSGGNAIGAAIAGCLVQATVQQEMTNHAGTITLLYYEAASGETYELNSWGTLVPELAPFRPVPPGAGHYASTYSPPCAAIPGFMPGMKVMHERFGTRPWAELCEPAIRWAEEGHEFGAFEAHVTAQTIDFFLHTPSGREHFAPRGHLPQVGDCVSYPELAKTLRALADEGPDYFITGGWARQFVKRANTMGWPIELRHMTAIPPRWGRGLRWRHAGREIVQLSPPERQAVFCALALGILEQLDIVDVGHYTQSPEALYYVAHALRRADQEANFVTDPTVFEDPTETLLDPAFHAFLAQLIRKSKPARDLTAHVEVFAGKNALAAAGRVEQPAGSCESTLVDPHGNWVQIMNTLQSGGIPGEVVGGVPMVGSHAQPSLASPIGGWFAGGGRIRGVIGNTFVFQDGQPIWSLGTPGNVYWTVAQVLLNGLDFGMDPYAAEDAARMKPLTDAYVLPVESRLPPDVVQGLARYGILIEALPAYDWHMGSYQMSWREQDGTLRSTVGPRRAGLAAAF